MKSPKLPIPTARKKILGRDAVKALETAIVKAGLTPVHVDPGQISVMSGDQITYLGRFQWVAKRGWMLFVGSPTIRCQSDFDIAMLDIPQATTLRAVDDAWRNYNGKRTEAAWQVYVGLLAQHYSRAITLAPVPVNPKRKP